MKRLRIVMVGGGSMQWAAYIIKDMLMTGAIRDSDFILLDIDKKASDLTAAFLTKLSSRMKTGARFISTDNRQRAMKNADYVVIAISTGGLKSMAHDLDIPEDYGIYHTVGDTSGPGGWARFIRNFNVFVSLGEDISRLAPNAVVLNYTNPMATLTAVLARVFPGPVIGLCHGLFENLDFLKRYAHLEREEDLSVRYAGLNHFFWMTDVRANGRDVLADLRRRVWTTSLTLLDKNCHPDPMGFTSEHEVATEMMRATGYLPYVGDRHICEFSSCYITDKKVMKRYRLVRTAVRDRQETLVAKRDKLRKALAGTTDGKYFQRSRETAADIIAAHSQGRPFIDVGNVPNIGQVSNLPRGTVVETAVRVDGAGFTPIAFGDLPSGIAGLLEPFCRSFDLNVEACFSGSRSMAIEALRLDPVCARLTGVQVEELGGRLLHAHRNFLPGKWR